MLLSEVNPYSNESGRVDSAPKTPVEQAKHWYGIDLRQVDFVGSIVELSQIARERNQALLVRDWTFINFESLGHSTPSLQLSTLKCLEQATEVKAVAFVRNAIDVWISRGCPPIQEFTSSYLIYVEQLRREKIDFFRYEDFCVDHQRTIRKMFEKLMLPPPTFSDKLGARDKVSGDVQFLSRGNWRGKVSTLGRKRLDRHQRRLLEEHRCEFERINKPFGYPSGYYDVPRESLLGVLRTKCAHHVLSLRDRENSKLDAS